MSEGPRFFSERSRTFVVLVQVPPEAHHISLQYPPLLRASDQGKPILEEETYLFHHRRLKGKVVERKLSSIRFDMVLVGIET